MGEFQSGKWVIGLSIYFFIFFLILYSTINAAAEIGVDHDLSVSDPGFQTDITPYTSGTCTGNIGLLDSFWCTRIPNIQSNETCTLISGCSWDGEVCVGSINLVTDCDSYNQTYCELLEPNGCVWNEDEDSSVDPTDAISPVSGLTESIKFLFGFNARLGMPGAYQFIISFFFFWIPFMALLWSLYMSLPFLH